MNVLHGWSRLGCQSLRQRRLQDPGDLSAQVLPRLSKPDPLSTCWPLLSPDAARSNPRWLQLCVLVLQAATRQHGYALLLAMPPGLGLGQPGPGIGLGLGSVGEAAVDIRVVHSTSIQSAAAIAAELVGAVLHHVRLAARKPQLLDWQPVPKWTVEAAAAALEAQGFAPGDQGTAAEPPAPQPAAGASAEEQAAATAAWEHEKANLSCKVGGTALGAINVVLDAWMTWAGNTGYRSVALQLCCVLNYSCCVWSAC